MALPNIIGILMHPSTSTFLIMLMRFSLIQLLNRWICKH